MFPAGCSFPPSNKRNAIRAPVLKSLPNDYSLSPVSLSPSKAERVAARRWARKVFFESGDPRCRVNLASRPNQSSNHGLSGSMDFSYTHSVLLFKGILCKNLFFFFFINCKNTKSLELEKKSMNTQNRMCGRGGLVCHCTQVCYCQSALSLISFYPLETSTLE